MYRVWGLGFRVGDLGFRGSSLGNRNSWPGRSDSFKLGDFLDSRKGMQRVRFRVEDGIRRSA